jgi:hypothetical protein
VDTGTLDITAAVPAAWTPAGGPGFPTTDIRMVQSGANNGGVGFAAAAHLTVAGASLGTTGLGATFGWTREDQFLDLQVTTLGAFNVGTFTADVTVTISKS